MGRPGSKDQPLLVGDRPVAGGKATANIRGPKNGMAVLAGGARRSNPISTNWGELYVDPNGAQFFPVKLDNNGEGSLDVAVPAAAIGATIGLQALVADSAGKLSLTPEGIANIKAR